MPDLNSVQQLNMNFVSYYLYTNSFTHEYIKLIGFLLLFVIIY